mmetsp:Transcript_25575/g.59007  ORF Transcript_25575/g.59007 Transcript_25575/m.59007 type:complete len:91 (-) Transcript_25575:807-1079(-)
MPLNSIEDHIKNAVQVIISHKSNSIVCNRLPTFQKLIGDELFTLEDVEGRDMISRSEVLQYVNITYHQIDENCKNLPQNYLPCAISHSST